MRRIKYRIRDSINKKFIVDDNSFTLLQDGRIMERYKTINGLSINENYIASQFTGLLDKHGKEIFEGDIVRVLYTDRPSKSANDNRTLDEYMNHLSNIGEVMRSEYKYKINYYFGGEGNILPGTHGWIEIEVIGNIYENNYHYEVITSKGLVYYDGTYKE